MSQQQPSLFSSLLVLWCPCLLDPPNSLSLSGTVTKKRLVAPSLSLTLSRRDSQDPSSEGLAPLSDHTPSLDINLEALETPSGSESGTLPELEWEGKSDLQPLLSLKDL